MRTAMMDIEDFGKLLASLIKEGNCVRNELCGIKSNPVDPSTIPTDNSYESLKKRYALKHPFPRTKIEQDYGFIIQFFNENCHKKDSSLYIYDPISGENASLKEILRDSYVRPFLEIPDGLFDKEDADPFADLDKLLGNPQ